MNKLETKKEDVVKAYKKASKKERKLLESLFGKEIFVEDITERVKTFEDACKILGIKLDLPDVSTMPKKHQKSLIAHYKLVIIAEALNEGWKPNWSDYDEYKYHPWFEYDKARSGFGFGSADWTSTGTSTYVGSRLCFKTKTLAEYIGKQFEELYNEYFL